MRNKTAPVTVNLPPHKTILRKPVLARTGMKHTALELAISRGEFPRPFKLTDSGRAVAWLESWIDDWLAERVTHRAEPRHQAERAEA